MTRKRSQDWTSIAVSKATRQRLVDLKIHPNQPYEEVIVMLLNEYTKEKEDE